MPIRRTTSEIAVWTFLAFAGGCVAGWFDLSSTEVQGTVVILMLVAFALTVPGRAPVLPVSIASALGIPAVRLFAGGQLNAGYLIVVIPALVGAAGGRVAGMLLDTAASTIEYENTTSQVGPWYRQPMSTRFILAVALVVIAIAGVPTTNAVLRSLGHPAHAWLALVWQIMTLLGWIGMTPLLLRVRNSSAASSRAVANGLRPADVIVQLGLVVVLAAAHALIVVGITGALFIPIVPSWGSMFAAALTAYVPLDLLAYLAIVALAHASDAERHRREAARREEALRAESLESRLTALRARLNPHFLFNALNSVQVLARSGKPDETIRVVEGLTTLLRYVLDERRPNVSLGDELAFAKEYLDIQRVRFGERLRYEIECPPQLLAASIPQLLLQPLIENAVEHGAARALDGGTVRVTAARNGEVLRVVVEDDGPGPESTEPSTGIGLANTRERLARLFGGRATLTFSGRQLGHPGGSRVVIDIPFEISQAAA